MYNQTLRGLIINSGKTQAEFAAYISLNKSDLSNIITGRRGKNRKKKQLIADFFNIPYEKLFKEKI